MRVTPWYLENSKKEWYNKGENLLKKKNSHGAFFCFLKGAELDDLESIIKVADMYVKADGVERNYSQAISWYMKSLNRKEYYTRSVLNIADLYKTGGHSIKKDYYEALQWFMKLAYVETDIKSKSITFYNVGSLYQQGGYGVIRDYTQALSWYKKVIDVFSSNESSHVEPMALDVYRKIGQIYQNGEYGVTKNPQEALVWYSKASDIKSHIEIKCDVKNESVYSEYNDIQVQSPHTKTVLFMSQLGLSPSSPNSYDEPPPSYQQAVSSTNIPLQSFDSSIPCKPFKPSSIEKALILGEKDINIPIQVSHIDNFTISTNQFISTNNRDMKKPDTIDLYTKKIEHLDHSSKQKGNQTNCLDQSNIALNKVPGKKETEQKKILKFFKL